MRAKVVKLCYFWDLMWFSLFELRILSSAIFFLLFNAAFWSSFLEKPDFLEKLWRGKIMPACIRVWELEGLMLFEDFSPLDRINGDLCDLFSAW
uniref:Uncharacterized protein n=1 Tax=Nelumbo nucifera TaxID=4432 RepID=A0A822YLA0_NELNU|nr:TPA_asm: hypothetical protein HUJ06_010537 [Nelumbo nucifera]